MNTLDASEIKALLLQLVTASPYIIVALAGFVFSLVKYRECPKACVLAAIGTSMLMVLRVFQIFAYSFWLPKMMIAQSIDRATITQVYSIFGVIMTLLTSAALGCIISAVFVGRGKSVRN